MTFKELFDAALKAVHDEGPTNSMDYSRDKFQNAVAKLLDDIIPATKWDKAYAVNPYGKNKSPYIKVISKSTATTSYYELPIMSYKIQCCRANEATDWAGRKVYTYTVKGCTDFHFVGRTPEESYKLLDMEVTKFLEALYNTDATIQSNLAKIAEHETLSESIMRKHNSLMQSIVDDLAIFRELPKDTQKILNENLVKLTGFCID